MAKGLSELKDPLGSLDGERGSVFRRQRWTDELLVIAAADLLQRLLIRELLIGGRQPQGLGRLSALAEEPLHARRPEEQEQAGLRRIDVERVRDVARSIDDRAGDRFDH